MIPGKKFCFVITSFITCKMYRFVLDLISSRFSVSVRLCFVAAIHPEYLYLYCYIFLQISISLRSYIKKQILKEDYYQTQEMQNRWDKYIRKKVRVVSIARDMPFGPLFHPYQVLSKCLQGYQSYRAHKDASTYIIQQYKLSRKRATTQPNVWLPISNLSCFFTIIHPSANFW